MVTRKDIQTGNQFSENLRSSGVVNDSGPKLAARLYKSSAPIPFFSNAQVTNQHKSDREAYQGSNRFGHALKRMLIRLAYYPICAETWHKAGVKKPLVIFGLTNILTM